MTLSSYNAKMRHTMGSKLFFLHHVPIEEIAVVVDFGCADASLLKALNGVMPEDCLLLGIDSDPKQRAAAAANFVDCDGVFDDWEYVGAYLNDMPEGRKALVIMSSVLHEVSSVEDLWAMVDYLRFDYVAIRDMAVPEDYRRREAPVNRLSSQMSNPERLALVKTIIRYHQMCSWSLEAWLHGMLKAVHVDDFEKEDAENYFRNSAEELEELLAAAPYRVKHRAHTVTPFFKEFCHERGVSLSPDVTTHIELLLERHR